MASSRASCKGISTSGPGKKKKCSILFSIFGKCLSPAVDFVCKSSCGKFFGCFFVYRLDIWLAFAYSRNELKQQKWLSIEWGGAGGIWQLPRKSNSLTRPSPSVNSNQSALCDDLFKTCTSYRQSSHIIFVLQKLNLKLYGTTYICAWYAYISRPIWVFSYVVSESSCGSFNRF